MNDRVTIFEVSPRDGLQNEARPIPTADKIALVDLLSGCGFTQIEAASFVSPKWVPQMADGAAVLAGIARRAGRRATRRCAEPEGLRGGARGAGRRGRDLRLGLGELQPAQHQLLDRREPRAIRAGGGGGARGRHAAARLCLLRDGLPVRGRVDPRAVARGRRLFALGCYEVSLGDTIGPGTPERSRDMLRAVLASRRRTGSPGTSTTPRAGRSRTSRWRSGCGLRIFDASCGGLGGCPTRRAPREMSRPRVAARWPSSVSRPASTGRGWPRRRPSRAGCAGRDEGRSAEIHRWPRLGGRSET